MYPTNRSSRAPCCGDIFDFVVDLPTAACPSSPMYPSSLLPAPTLLIVTPVIAHRYTPAREFTLSCHGDVFQTSFKYGGRSYVTSLYNEKIAGSKRIKSWDMTCNYVLVWSDRIGITQVEFVHSEVLNTKSRVSNHVKEEG